MGLRRLPPQILALSPHTDLVTVTVGGNDVGYIGTLIMNAVGSRLRAKGPAGRVASRLPLLTRVPDPASVFETAQSALHRTVDAIHEAAPNARIVLVDYLTVCGVDTEPSAEIPLAPELIERYREIADALAAATETAGTRGGADVVRMSKVSSTHGLGSSEPWVTGFPAGLTTALRTPPFHPNHADMAATANEVAAQIDT